MKKKELFGGLPEKERLAAIRRLVRDNAVFPSGTDEIDEVVVRRMLVFFVADGTFESYGGLFFDSMLGSGILKAYGMPDGQNLGRELFRDVVMLAHRDEPEGFAEDMEAVVRLETENNACALQPETLSFMRGIQNGIDGLFGGDAERSEKIFAAVREMQSEGFSSQFAKTWERLRALMMSASPRVINAVATEGGRKADWTCGVWNPWKGSLSAFARDNGEMIRISRENGMSWKFLAGHASSMAGKEIGAAALCATCHRVLDI